MSIQTSIETRSLPRGWRWNWVRSIACWRRIIVFSNSTNCGRVNVPDNRSWKSSLSYQHTHIGTPVVVWQLTGVDAAQSRFRVATQFHGEPRIMRTTFRNMMRREMLFTVSVIVLTFAALFCMSVYVKKVSHDWLAVGGVIGVGEDLLFGPCHVELRNGGPADIDRRKSIRAALRMAMTLPRCRSFALRESGDSTESIRYLLDGLNVYEFTAIAVEFDDDCAIALSTNKNIRHVLAVARSERRTRI